MISVYSTNTQTVAANGVYVYENIAAQYGVCTSFAAGSGNIVIQAPGVYLVSFNSDTATAAEGNVSAQLYLNGTLYSGAEATETVPAAGIANLKFTTLVRINPNCCAVRGNVPATLTVRNTATVEATATNAALTVTRVR